MAGQKIGMLVIAMVVVLVGIRLLDPIATGVADVSGLAILGSTGGGAALVNIITLVAIAGMLLSAVTLLFPQQASSVLRRVRRR